MTAPVCPTSRSQPVAAKMPALRALPAAVDLPSLINGINAARNFIGTYTGTTINNVWQPPPAFTLVGSPVNSTGGTGVSGALLDWSEVSRDTEEDTVYHKDSNGVIDKNQYVVVRRILDITFAPDGSSFNTGMTWIGSYE